MTRLQYPEELRLEAQRQHEAGRSLRAIAQDLGVSHEAVRQWVRPGDSEDMDPNEREEIRSLRRRLRQVEEERDILKKAVAFFARDSEDR